MVEYTNENLSILLKAISDATRRTLLTTLCQQGACRVTELADAYEMSLNAISKHIKVLENAGLVTRTTIGRTHLIQADLSKTHEIQAWFTGLHSIWEMRLDNLNKLIQTGEDQMPELSLRITKTIDAPINTAYEAWLDAKLLAQFMLPAPGMPEPEIQIDASESGEFTIIMQVGENKIPHTGKYIKINKPHQLIFTWNSPLTPDDSKVTLNFSALGENQTRIELTHIKFLNEQGRDNHKGGWKQILSKMSSVLA